MGRRGPQPKLAVIKRLEGNPGKFPRHVIEEDGIAGLGEPFIPEHLPDDARGCIEVIQKSMPPSVYSALDSFLLCGLRDGLGRSTNGRRMRSAIPTLPSPYRNSTGAQVPSPWIKILNQQATILASLGDRLGLDPKSRAALKLPSARQQRSKFEGLIGQTGLYRPLRN